jgi:class 3 adenylate cyclase
MLALIGAFIVTRLIVDTAEERFARQLLEAGRLVTDRIVEIEQESLEVVRFLARTEGFAEAVSSEDRATLERLAFPVAFNEQAELVEILDRSGSSLGSLHDYEWVEVSASWEVYPFVAKVLQEQSDDQGDKFAGLVFEDWGGALYVAGPVFEQDTLVGAILVGRRLERLPEELSQFSASQHVTLYQLNGTPLVTSFALDDLELLRLPADLTEQVLSEQDEAMFSRDIPFRGRNYREALGPFEIRGGADIGIVSAALVESNLVQAQASPITQAQMILLIAAGLLAVVLVGTLVAQRISGPIVEVARASKQVAEGNLDQQVYVRTRDEVGDLAEAFNEMVRELKRGQQIRDLFGRAVSPQISQAMIEAVETGEIALTGENRAVTTLFTDIRGFTAIAEGRPPKEVVAILNEVLGTFIDVIDGHDGVVNKFGGDSLLAIFGAPIFQPDHACRAVEAGLEMSRRLTSLNEKRQAQGLVTIEAGIGINTGEVVAGAIGSTERFEYTVIGDAVNVTARVQALGRRFEEFDLFITVETLHALGHDHGLDLVDLGTMPLRGKSEPVQVYAVRGRSPARCAARGEEPVSPER